MTSRPGWTQYYCRIAGEVASRGTCLRRNHGAVIVRNSQIVATGYTGAARGMSDCHAIGQCPRDKARVPPGQRYELCRSVHAEANAIIHAARSEMLGGSLHLAGLDAITGEIVDSTEPCRMCRRLIINAGLDTVFVLQSDREPRRIAVQDWMIDQHWDDAEW